MPNAGRRRLPSSICDEEENVHTVNDGKLCTFCGQWSKVRKISLKESFQSWLTISQKNRLSRYATTLEYSCYNH